MREASFCLCYSNRGSPSHLGIAVLIVPSGSFFHAQTNVSVDIIEELSPNVRMIPNIIDKYKLSIFSAFAHSSEVSSRHQTPLSRRRTSRRASLQDTPADDLRRTGTSQLALRKDGQGFFSEVALLLRPLQFTFESAQFLALSRSDAHSLGTLLCHVRPLPDATSGSTCRRCPVHGPPAPLACHSSWPTPRLSTGGHKFEAPSAGKEKRARSLLQE